VFDRGAGPGAVGAEGRPADARGARAAGAAPTRVARRPRLSRKVLLGWLDEVLLACGPDELRCLYRAWERRTEAQIWLYRYEEDVLVRLVDAVKLVRSDVDARAREVDARVTDDAVAALWARIATSAKDDEHFRRRKGGGSPTSGPTPARPSTPRSPARAARPEVARPLRC